MSKNWIEQILGLQTLEPETRRALERHARIVTLPAGNTVFRDGDACENYLLVLDGTVRVQMTAKSGREIVLYRVDAGQTCVLTTACLLAHQVYTAEAVTESEVHAVALPSSVFADLLGKSAVLRDFVFSTFGTRIADLMMLVEEIAFGRIDIRLAKFLKDHAGADGHLNMTHQALAVELGTAREVVSRVLKEFEHRGMISLSRGQVQVLRSELIAAHAGMNP